MALNGTLPGYHGSRLRGDPRPKVLWRSLWRHHFSAGVQPDDRVLDLGSGHGSFINAAVAARRIAVDAWDGFPAYLADGVEHAVGPVADLDFIADDAVDFTFASNLLEHLTKDDFAVVLAALYCKLAPDGTLTIVQPNYPYAFREYFDDHNHRSVFTHVSLPDFPAPNGYEVFRVVPRFMPLKVKGRLPVTPWLSRAWLASPVKPLGKQMLVRVRPRR